MVSRWPKMAPTWPEMTRRWPKHGLSGPQDGPKMAQHRPLGQVGVISGPFWSQFGANLVLLSAILVSTCTPEANILFFPLCSTAHFAALLGHLGALWVPHRLAKFVANQRRDARKAFPGLPCSIQGPSWAPRRFDIVPSWFQDGQTWF